MIKTKIYDSPLLREEEIIRYTGARVCDDSYLIALIRESCEELLPRASYRICYTEINLLSSDKEICVFDEFTVKSASLSKNLRSCKKVILLAATVGIEIDRLINKYGSISPLKALVMQAIGAERIESLCDRFCEDFEKEFNVKTCKRFSPGYGDLDLSTQKEIFRLLECEKTIGLYLNDTFSLSPSKSVTAFIGIKE